jgi:hypothetical protein
MEMSCKRKQKRNSRQEFMYRDEMNVQYEMYDYTSNKWSNQNSNSRFEEKFGSHSLDSVQQTAIQGTSHLIHGVQKPENGSGETMGRKGL